VGLTTVIIGIRCKNGIVIASDSQIEYYRGVSVKKMNANKIYQFTVGNGIFFIGGAGRVADIEKLVTFVWQSLDEISKREPLTMENVYGCIEQTVTDLHKEYNIERMRYLGYNVNPFETPFFDPMVILADVLRSNQDCEFLLNIIHPTGLVEPVSDYATVGSGAAYAELLLKNLYSSELSVDVAVPIAIYVVEEVKSIDPSVGGDTQVAYAKYIEKEGKKEIESKMLEKDEIMEIAKNARALARDIWNAFIDKIRNMKERDKQ